MVALEQMEAVRYAEFLKPDGVAVINDYAIKSTTIASGAETYPDGCIEAMEKVFRTIAVPASEIALDLGNARCMNVVLCSALCATAWAVPRSTGSRWWPTPCRKGAGAEHPGLPGRPRGRPEVPLIPETDKKSRCQAPGIFSD